MIGVAALVGRGVALTQRTVTGAVGVASAAVVLSVVGTATAVGVGVGLTRASATLLDPRPRRTSRSVTDGGAVRRDRSVSSALRTDLRNALDPRPGRHHRRIQEHLDWVHLEIRGLTGQHGNELSALLEQGFQATPGLLWWHLNAVTGRVAVGLDPAQRSAADVLTIVGQVERQCGTDRLAWNRHLDLPGDREPVLAAALALVADLTGLAVAVSTRALPVPASAQLVTAAMALVDAQPRLRRLLEDHLGVSRSDLVLTAGNAAAQALNRGAATLAVDAGQRLSMLRELQAARSSWRRWEARLAGPGGISITDPLLTDARPLPLPPGPIERFAEQAATGSLLAAAGSLLGRQGAAAAADALLVGVPKASRTSRESFASTLAAALARQGALTLDSSVWRRLDRVSAVVIDSAAVRSGPLLVLDARSSHHGWSSEHVWSAGQRLLSRSQDGSGTPSGSLLTAALPVPPPRGRSGPQLALADHPDGQAATTIPAPGQSARWHQLVEDSKPVGEVLIGRELHGGADTLLAAARRAGLRVVLVGEQPGSELRTRAEEFLAAPVSLTDTVRRLQSDGHVVALVSATAHRALAAADVGLGVVTAVAGQPLHLPWSSDVVCPDLAMVEQILAATGPARLVSERGRTLALSASALGALLLVAGPRPGAWHRAVHPITGAALVGLVSGTRSAQRAARPVPTAQAPLLPWHCLEADEVLARLPTPLPAAASPEQRWWVGAGRSLAAATPAMLVRPVVRPLAGALALGGYVRQELSDPLTPVLTVGAAASAILGAPTDAALVGSVLGVNAVVSAVQRQRADRAMRDLRLSERIYAHRVTGGQSRSVDLTTVRWRSERIPADQLRPGDVLTLTAGDLVPADARLLAVDGLELDESGLTGESVTVDKQLAATPGAPLGDRACMVFEGSVVVAGSGRAIVVAVGDATQAGRAVAAIPVVIGSGGVQAQLRALTDKALPLTLGGGAIVSALGMLRAQPLRAAVADGVAVAVAAVPEGLPLVATVAQLAAARRLSRRGVLVRSSRTVEALGRVDTMCFDKTGTLTEGVLRLVQLADLQRVWTAAAAEGSPDARRLLRAAARACPDPRVSPVVHATDRAVLDAAGTHLNLQASHVWDPVEQVPFESNRGYAATLGHSRRALRLIVKGAPEVLLPRCSQALTSNGEGPPTVQPLRPADTAAALAAVHALAAQGLRVLLVARRELRDTPADLETAVDDLTLMGFIGLADTPRPATGPVIAELTGNGISVRMITGDHPVTAEAIAVALGIPHTAVVTGAELDALEETTQTALINASTVFARVSPEHKVRIVAALQRGGKVVAMTGDGSNDAAAIRLADVGIGLATHGSAAARNAADLVLTEPDLTLLLDALVEGRIMWQRVRDAVAILVGGNAGEVAFTILGTALSGRAPVGTRQFLLVNLLTDMFPAMAVALAHPRAAASPQTGMTPVTPAERAGQVSAELALLPTPELGRELLRSIAVRGAATTAGASAAWLVGRGSGLPRRASTMGLVALVGTQLGQTVLLGGRSPLVWVTAGLSGAVLVGIVQTPGLSQFFGCTPLDPAAWVVVGACAGAATAGSVLLPRVLPAVEGPLQAVLHRGAGLLQVAVGGLQQQMACGQQ